MKTKFIYPLLLVLCLQLLSCGFKLRGSYFIPKWFSSVQIQAPNNEAPLKRKLGEIFKRHDINVSQVGAKATVQINSVKLLENTTRDSGKIESKLSLTVQYSVYHLKQKKLAGSTQQHITYEYLISDALNSENQKQKARNQLNEQVANAILEHISRH